MLASEANTGDVVQAPDGQVYQLITADGAVRVWGNITPIGGFGPPFEPEGDLVRLVPEADGG